jgi:hypothetical protein
MIVSADGSLDDLDLKSSQPSKRELGYMMKIEPSLAIRSQYSGFSPFALVGQVQDCELKLA